MDVIDWIYESLNAAMAFNSSRSTVEPSLGPLSLQLSALSALFTASSYRCGDFKRFDFSKSPLCLSYFVVSLFKLSSQDLFRHFHFNSWIGFAIMQILPLPESDESEVSFSIERVYWYSYNATLVTYYTLQSHSVWVCCKRCLLSWKSLYNYDNWLSWSNTICD